ncbi:MAG: aminotransferase class I/II-fold pyridoxal phosphate-dependent enzyme [Chloroflexi bacterium]|nr:aminotransferase class I/II-fold pyridoxal phosphate-dependent enzyme [Chloroflexota bacterium]
MTTHTVNPNIPDAIRAVAADGTQLRYALMEMSNSIPDAIALGRGDPDLMCPPHIREAAAKALHDHVVTLSPVAGLPELREAVAQKLNADNSIPASAENVIITTGGQEGLYLIMQALIDPGDEVLIPDPRYTSYDEAVSSAGGKIVLVPTTHADAFDLRPEAVEAAITPQTKAILIITPSNPTSGIVSEPNLRAIAEIAQRRNLIVISDEIYEKFVYAPWTHVSIASFPGMAERTITLNGFSKTYAMTGLRVGYVCAPANVIDAMTRVKAQTTGPAATVSQWAALAALEQADASRVAIEGFRQIYGERRALMMQGLTDLGLDYSEPRGGFFLWTNSSSTGIHATELAYLLLKEGKVLIFPGTAFGANWSGYLRVSVLQDTALLREALERMRPIIERYRV